MQTLYRVHVSGTHQATAQGPVERYLEVLGRVEDYPDWYPGVKTFEVIHRDERARPTAISLVIDTGVSKYGEIPVQLDYDWRDQPAGLALRRTAGKPSQLEGLWQLTPDGEGTSVRLTLELDIATGMPGFVERQLGLRDKVVELMIERPVARLIRRVELSSSPRGGGL